MHVSDEEDILRETQELRWYDPDHAIRVLQRFLKTSLYATRAKLRLASILAEGYGGGTREAERLFRAVLERDPDNVSAICGLALLHGHPDSSISPVESLGLLSRASAIAPNRAMLTNLANKAWDIGDYSTARSAFERLVTLARSRGEDQVAKTAEAAIASLLRGEKPSSFHYEWPEVSPTQDSRP